MPRSDEIAIRAARLPDDLPVARELFRRYAEGLDFSLCFQGFDQELAGLPGEYAPPDGALLIAWQGEAAVGCVALRRQDAGRAEMKRLYLAPAVRRTGLGRRLAVAAIEAARERGYGTILLDTVPGQMDAAIGLYGSLGFRRIAPYNDSPLPGIVHMALALR